MRISQQKIDQIITSADIVDVISQYVSLRKRGRNYIGLCPFHTEKTPSFSVTQDKQMFRCFGCQKGGNVVKFLMEYKKIGYVDALRELAELTGITLEFESGDVRGREPEYEVEYELNNTISRLFQEQLLSTNEGALALKYLKDRKITDSAIHAFGLGYSPASRSFLSEYIEKNKLPVDVALALGLIMKNENGKLIDRFSGRVMFTIHSHVGRIVAFAGRVLDEKQSPVKYMNSPESQIYHKSSVLYGLFQAKDEIRRNDLAIIVEGYMDLLSLYQHDIRNVVAVSGTALTDEQIVLLSRHTKNVVLLFDADMAGLKASLRSIELLLKRNMKIKIASLAQGEDPDSFINKYGKEEFLKSINSAQLFLDYQFGVYEKQGVLEDPRSAATAIRELLKQLVYIQDPIEQSFLLRSVSRKYDLDIRMLEQELRREEKKVTVNDKRNTDNKTRKQNETKAEAGKTRNNFKNPLENKIIGLLLQGEPEITEFLLRYVTIDEIQSIAGREIFRIIREMHDNGEEPTINTVADRIVDELLLEYISKTVMEKYFISDQWEKLSPATGEKQRLIKEARDTVKRFKLNIIDRDTKILLEMLKSAEDEGERERINKSVKEMRKLREQTETMFNVDIIRRPASEDEDSGAVI